MSDWFEKKRKENDDKFKKIMLIFFVGIVIFSTVSVIFIISVVKEVEQTRVGHEVKSQLNYWFEKVDK